MQSRAQRWWRERERSTYRRPEQRVVTLPELGPLVAWELERGGRVALVFGPEKHGLTREELSFCHLLVEIPTDARQPSMNLGQAVAVCLYELAMRTEAAESGRGLQRINHILPRLLRASWNVWPRWWRRP